MRRQAASSGQPSPTRSNSRDRVGAGHHLRHISAVQQPYLRVRPQSQVPPRPPPQAAPPVACCIETASSVSSARPTPGIQPARRQPPGEGHRQAWRVYLESRDCRAPSPDLTSGSTATMAAMRPMKAPMLQLTFTIGVTPAGLNLSPLPKFRRSPCDAHGRHGKPASMPGSETSDNSLLSVSRAGATPDFRAIHCEILTLQAMALKLDEDDLAMRPACADPGRLRPFRSGK